MYYFIYLLYASCMLIDVVPVSSEQPVEVDQEQLFEEEEQQPLSKEGKWLLPLHISVLYNCMTTKVYFYICYCINLLGYLVRTTSHLLSPMNNPVYKCFG